MRKLFVGVPLVAVPWLVFVVVGQPRARVAIGAPPRVPEGDLLAGAMYAWAETDDAVALDAQSEALSLRNEGDSTTTHLDAIALEVFAEPVVRTHTGAFVAVREMRDVPPHTTIENERSVSAIPLAANDSVVVLDAKSTHFAERAYFSYVAKMGQGLDTIMERAVRTDCPREHTTTCAAEVMEDEQRRLGLPLLGEARDGDAVVARFVVYPPGATHVRKIALPLPRRATALRLEATPGFWEVERVMAGRHDGERSPKATFAPTAATAIAPDGSRRDVTALVAKPDGARLVLTPGERLDLSFGDTTAGAATYVAARGYYRVPIGGRALVDPFVVLAHRAGVVSLPRFARP